MKTSTLIVKAEIPAGNKVAKRLAPLLQHTAAMARPRRISRTRAGKLLAAHGHGPSADTWRDTARRYLRRCLPENFHVYQGGCHLAVILTVQGVVMTVARLVETKARRSR